MHIKENKLETTTEAQELCLYLRHPLTLAFWALWILNDHFFKAMFANELTGKLSDVASLAVFPLFPLACYDIISFYAKRPRKHFDLVLYASLVATGMVMVGINISPAWAEAYRHGLGLAQWPFLALKDLLNSGELSSLKTVKLTMDPSDSYTLPALFIPWLVVKKL